MAIPEATEEFKPIPGFPRYSISRAGEVYDSVRRRQITHGIYYYRSSFKAVAYVSLHGSVDVYNRNRKRMIIVKKLLLLTWGPEAAKEFKVPHK
jgi:hypothetical protein